MQKIFTGHLPDKAPPFWILKKLIERLLCLRTPYAVAGQLIFAAFLF